MSKDIINYMYRDAFRSITSTNSRDNQSYSLKGDFCSPSLRRLLSTSAGSLVFSDTSEERDVRSRLFGIKLDFEPLNQHFIIYKGEYDRSSLLLQGFDFNSFAPHISINYSNFPKEITLLGLTSCTLVSNRCDYTLEKSWNNSCIGNQELSDFLSEHKL